MTQNIEVNIYNNSESKKRFWNFKINWELIKKIWSVFLLVIFISDIIVEIIHPSIENRLSSIFMSITFFSWLIIMWLVDIRKDIERNELRTLEIWSSFQKILFKADCTIDRIEERLIRLEQKEASKNE